MKFTFRSLFNLTHLKAAIYGIMPQLLTPQQYDAITFMRDRDVLEKVRKRIIYLFTHDNKLHKVLDQDRRYVVDVAMYGDKLIVAIYIVVENIAGRITDDVRRKRGLKTVHSERMPARDRFRYIYRRGEMNIATRSQTQLLFHPDKPLLVYVPDWGLEIGAMLGKPTPTVQQAPRYWPTATGVN